MSRSWPVALALILTVGLALTASAATDDKSSTLTGTWNLTAVIFGVEGHAMATFFKDGTFIHTGAAANNVNAHGVWKMVAPRTFVERNREYVYQDQKLALFADTLEVIEMSEDGQSWVGEAVTELKLLDGTVIDVVSFTVYGTRMTLDSELATPPGRR